MDDILFWSASGSLLLPIALASTSHRLMEQRPEKPIPLCTVTRT
jgi:hypothetical protein